MVRHFVQGGSKPPSFQGWQRHTRQIPFAAPRIGPYFRRAWIMYSLQLGVNRHVGGSNGRTVIRYAQTSPISSPERPRAKRRIMTVSPPFAVAGRPVAPAFAANP